MTTRRCDTSHASDYTSGREATIDLGKHMRVVGVPGKVRFLCDHCARGLHIPDKYRIAR